METEISNALCQILSSGTLRKVSNTNKRTKLKKKGEKDNTKTNEQTKHTHTHTPHTQKQNKANKHIRKENKQKAKQNKTKTGTLSTGRDSRLQVYLRSVIKRIEQGSKIRNLSHQHAKSTTWYQLEITHYKYKVVW